MIDYLEWGTCGIIFAWDGSTIKTTWPDMLVALIIGIVANCLLSPDVGNLGEHFKWFTTDGHDLLTMPLAFLLVYRTGMSYNRFFEGRSHVGQMVHACREFARGLSTYVKGDDPTTLKKRANCARLVKAYTTSVRLSLRKLEAQPEALAELETLLTGTEMAKIKAVKKNFPLIIIKWLGECVREFKGQLLFDRATDFLDANLSSMMQSWMGMHKLATTPMPFPYVQMLYALLYGWMWTCGFPFTNKYGWISLIAVLMLGYTLFGINAIGQELEDPFGEEDNDLPLEFFEGGANAACKLMLPKALTPEEIEPTAATAATTPNPLAVSTPGAPLDVQTILADPQFESKVRAELTASSAFGQLSPELQVVFKSYFERYDMGSNGVIDGHKELTQLATNLCFALKLGDKLGGFMDKVDANGDAFSFDPAQFTEWFLAASKELL